MVFVISLMKEDYQGNGKPPVTIDLTGDNEGQKTPLNSPSRKRRLDALGSMAPKKELGKRRKTSHIEVSYNV
jgi:hypothetical protein